MRTYAAVEADFDRTLAEVDEIERQLKDKRGWLETYAKEYEMLIEAGVEDERDA